MQTSKTERPANLVSGILLVFIGSACYGMLSTFVKLAYGRGFSTAEVTSAQFIWGGLVLTLLAKVFASKGPIPTAAERRDLLLAGTTTGFTSVLYYISVQYIPASIAVVLLMQSIWLGVLFESVTTRKVPSLEKVWAVLLVLLGTVLATNAFDTASSASLDPRGLVFGILSAISYSGTLAATGRVAPRLSSIVRSQYMVYGGAAVVFVFAMLTQVAPHYFDITLVNAEFVRNKPFDFDLLWTFGLVIAVFGTILPPILLNKGFPITGVGLGSIISSIELPFAAVIAFLFLNERITAIQLLGICIILGSVFVLNFRMVKRPSA